MEKQLQIKHSTFWDLFQPMIGQSVEIASKKKFRTNQYVKQYRLTSFGLFHLIVEFEEELESKIKEREFMDAEGGKHAVVIEYDDQTFETDRMFPFLYPRDPIFNYIISRIQSDEILWPWMHRQAVLLNEIGAEDLFRQMVLAARWNSTADSLDDDRYIAEIFGFFLDAIFYEQPLWSGTFMGFDSHLTYYLRLDNDPDFRKKSELMKKQVLSYMGANPEIKRVLLQHIEWTKENVDKETKDLRKVQNLYDNLPRSES
jgi:hypothetical protein